MPVIDRIKDFQNDLVAIRRDIHAHPEIGFEETRTSESMLTISRPRSPRSAIAPRFTP